LFGKHTDKLDADAAKKVRSMPVLLGRKRSLSVMVAMIAVQYSLIVTLVAAGFFSPWLLLSLLAFPASWKAAKVMRHPVPEQKPADFPAEIWPLWYAPFAFDHTRKFGAVFLLGLLLDILLA
jgi:1,4-dihydroxy-2-naphthoate octaprenyltransferase